MRYKKGSKVEVFCKDEVPSGSWRCGEVISRNGHNYSVRSVMGAKDEAIFEKVSRKLIRPRPPPVQISGGWMPGDVVEVFLSYSWKMAIISKVLSGDRFLVRLVGSLNEFKVPKVDIRLRHSWMDGKWVLVGKGSGNADDQKCSEQCFIKYKWKSGSSKAIKAKSDSHEEKDHVNNNISLQESHMVSGKTLKRGSRNCCLQAIAHENIQKFRSIEKVGRYHRVIVVDPSPLDEIERIENCAYLKKTQGGKEIYSLLDNRTMAQFPEMDRDGIRMNDTIGYSQSGSLECNDADDVTSSVGSCSVSNDNSIEWPFRMLTCPAKHAEYHSSDAESVCPLHNEEENYLCSNDKDLAAEIHRLELHAYRCTMEALHASGPLSWEQETLITNLRISLHISNDEHLMELRNLKCKQHPCWLTVKWI